LGDLAAAFYFPPVSFLVVVTGLLWLLGGWAMVRELAFPLFLLLFMIPLPAMVMKSLTMPLQLISSQLAAGMLQGIGVPVMRQGNIIDWECGIARWRPAPALHSIPVRPGLYLLLFLSALLESRRSPHFSALSAILCQPLGSRGPFPSSQEGFWHSFSGGLFLFCFGLLALLNWLLNYLSRQLPRPEGRTRRYSSFPSCFKAVLSFYLTAA
jgi:hypothetical protein